MSLRDDILALAAQGRRREAVDMSDFEGWPDKVWVQELSAADRDTINATMMVQRGKQMGTDFANLRAKTLVRALVDEDGTRLFTAADTAALGSLGDAAIGRLFEVAQRLSGMTDEGADEISGNSPAGETGSSPSD